MLGPVCGGRRTRNVTLVFGFAFLRLQMPHEAVEKTEIGPMHLPFETICIKETWSPVSLLGQD